VLERERADTYFGTAHGGAFGVGTSVCLEWGITKSFLCLYSHKNASVSSLMATMQCMSKVLAVRAPPGPGQRRCVSTHVDDFVEISYHFSAIQLHTRPCLSGCTGAVRPYLTTLKAFTESLHPKLCTTTSIISLHVDVTKIWGVLWRTAIRNRGEGRFRTNAKKMKHGNTNQGLLS
jgi:hypothetical protein